MLGTVQRICEPLVSGRVVSVREKKEEGKREKERQSQATEVVALQ